MNMKLGQFHNAKLLIEAALRLDPTSVKLQDRQQQILSELEYSDSEFQSHARSLDSSGEEYFSADEDEPPGREANSQPAQPVSDEQIAAQWAEIAALESELEQAVNQDQTVVEEIEKPAADLPVGGAAASNFHSICSFCAKVAHREPRRTATAGASSSSGATLAAARASSASGVRAQSGRTTAAMPARYPHGTITRRLGPRRWPGRKRRRSQAAKQQGGGK